MLRLPAGVILCRKLISESALYRVSAAFMARGGNLMGGITCTLLYNFRSCPSMYCVYATAISSNG